MYCTKSNWEINDTTKKDWGYDTYRDLSDNFTKEVGCYRIHIIIYFSQENWSLIWEDKDNILDSIKGDCHCHKEKGSVSVLHSLRSSITILEKNNGKNSCNNCNNNLDIGSLWESEGVQEVSLDEET
jgi:hypothetical protein